MLKKFALISLLLMVSFSIFGKTYTDRIEKGFVKYWVEGAPTARITLDSASFANLVITEKVILDIAGGSLTLQDGTILYFTDDTEADSVYMSHDGTDFVVTGDDGTTAIELEGLELELSNGATVVNTDANNLTITEAFVKIAGAIQATKTTEQFRLSYDATNYLTATLADDGHTSIVTVDPDGAEADINLNPDGNVGIKTANPSVALEVTGAGKISADLEVNGTINLNGTTENGINATGTFSDHVIDIQPAATMGDNKAIYIGTWGTEAEMNDGGGLFRIYGKVGAGGTATANIFVRTLSESTTPPITAQFYTDVDAEDSASAPNTMDGIDVFAMINANKYFAEPANDSLDMLQGMRSAWFKVGADVSSHIYGNVATIWVDNQLNCTPTGNEYAIFSTCGGSKPDAWAGFETTSSGWSYLFEFDKTSYNQDPVSSGNASTGSTDYYLKVNINGVAYGIQLYAL